jgi:hypothetical protein
MRLALSGPHLLIVEFVRNLIRTSSATSSTDLHRINMCFDGGNVEKMQTPVQKLARTAVGIPRNLLLKGGNAQPNFVVLHLNNLVVL